MFGALIDLFILISIAAFALIAWKFFQQRADEKLRDNPPPKRIVEVSLPVGVSDSAANMSRFYRKVAGAAFGDKSAKKAGMRQIDFVYLVDVPAEGALPRLRCRIYTDPDKMEAVKKALKSSFQEAIDLVELSEDDLLPIARALRPPDDQKDLIDLFDKDDEKEDAVSVASEGVDKEGALEEIDEEDALEESGQPSLAQDEPAGKEEGAEGGSINLDKILEEDTPSDISALKPRPASSKPTIDFVLDEEEEGPPKF